MRRLLPEIFVSPGAKAGAKLRVTLVASSYWKSFEASGNSQ
jgi:hypothetical protein